MTNIQIQDLLVSLGRYVLVTAGPVFTEEMWRLACCALQDAFSATLKPVKVKCGQEEPEQGPAFLCPLPLSGRAPDSALLPLAGCLTRNPAEGEREVVGSVLPSQTQGQCQLRDGAWMHPGNVCCVSP